MPPRLKRVPGQSPARLTAAPARLAKLMPRRALGRNLRLRALWTHVCEVGSPGRPAGLLPRAAIRAHRPSRSPSSAAERSPTNTAACATTTKHDPRADRRSRFLTRRAHSRQANSPVAVRYRTRREPRPDRSPRSQRSFATSATYGNNASSRALDSARDLALMAAARSRDPARADLAALGDEPA
jgi:hypothetical protein